MAMWRVMGEQEDNDKLANELCHSLSKMCDGLNSLAVARALIAVLSTTICTRNDDITGALQNVDKFSDLLRSQVYSDFNTIRGMIAADAGVPYNRKEN